MDLILFITEKINGDINTSNVAASIKHRTYNGYNKSNGLYTTLNTGSVILTGVMDLNDQRAVEMLDIDNAFLHVENDGYVLMLLCAKLSELLVKVDPKLCKKYVITLNQGVTMIYVKQTKALYGMLSSTMLFYKKLRRHLEEIGSEINPYDTCVANMTINNYQMNFCWLVDDLKVSHK